MIAHPSRSAYNAGCRCAPCRAANKEYQRQRSLRCEPGHVDATEVRLFIQFLSKKGVGRRAVADACDLDPLTVFKIRTGRRSRIHTTTARRIMAVTEDARADSSLVPAAPVKRQLRALIEDGWPRELLSRELGFAGSWLPIYSQARKFEARTASKVERLVRRIEGGYLQRLA